MSRMTSSPHTLFVAMIERGHVGNLFLTKKAQLFYFQLIFSKAKSLTKALIWVFITSGLGISFNKH